MSCTSNPDIDHLLDPQEQRWDLVQPAAVRRELPLSSSATYLFSDRTIRLSDSSFVLSVGFSPEDEHCCILTSKQTVLLPSSLQSSPLTSVPPTADKQQKTTYQTYTRLFDHNRKLGCFQLAYHGTQGRWMDWTIRRTILPRASRPVCTYGISAALQGSSVTSFCNWMRLKSTCFGTNSVAGWMWLSTRPVIAWQSSM